MKVVPNHGNVDGVDGLKEQHRELSRRVAELDRRAILTPTEHYEARDLKKQKLIAKDAIAARSRDA